MSLTIHQALARNHPETQTPASGATRRSPEKAERRLAMWHRPSPVETAVKGFINAPLTFIARKFAGILINV